MITYFKSLNDTGVPYHIDIGQAIKRIREGVSKTTVELIRSEKDKSIRNSIKKKLPAICFSGTFSQRSDASVIKHSGFICIDFDGFTDEWAMLNARHKMISDSFSYCVFTSPSGDGLKVIVKIPAEINNHKNYFSSLEKHYNMSEFDVTSKNISRICFESYDPDIYVNDNSSVWSTITVEEHQSFDKVTSRQTIKLTDNNEVIRRLNIWWNSKFGLLPGSRNNNTFVLASAYNEYGIDKFDALSALSDLASEDFPMSEIKVCLDSAYKNSDAHGSKFYEDTVKVDSINTMIKKGIPAEQVISMNNDIPIELVQSVISNISTSDVSSFWSKNSKGVIIHINHQYKKYLESSGYYKFYPENGQNSVFVKIQNNTISDAFEDSIKDYVLDYLLEKDDLSIYNYFAEKTKLFKEDHLTLLSKIDPIIMADNEKTAHLYFNNCALKITANNVEVIDYMNIKGYVWDSQKINRDFNIADFENCEFSRFMNNIAGGEIPRKQSMESTLGYLLHGYKKPSFSPAVILNDELISDNPEGGTGKGIFVSSITHLIPVVTIDGKAWSFSKSFPYQRVQVSTKVIVFDDAARNFEFEKLFSVITEGITLEKKNKDEIHIPFERSPKIVISTNYAIKGSGNSFERRKWELEFAQYYHKGYTPNDEFGHDLFSGWDSDEWLKFDNYMVSNIQLYLRDGLVKSKFKNLEERKLIAETSHDFYEWAKDSDNKMTKHNQITNLITMFNSFTQDNPDFSRTGKYALPLVKFHKWLDSYGEFKYSCRPEVSKCDGSKCIKFIYKEDEQGEISYDY
jgi:hypothetical protein